MVVQKRRDVGASSSMRCWLKSQYVKPEAVVTDGFRSYDAALAKPGLMDRHHAGDCPTIIGQKPALEQSEGVNGRYRVSRASRPRSAFLRRKRPSTTPSIFCATC